MTSQLIKVRKLKPSETFLDLAQRDLSMYITCYWLKLSSKQRLEEDQVKEALKILYRNADNLSLCIREEDSKMWFCRMEEEVIDFKTIKNKSPDEVLNEEMHISFNSQDGPLWRAKYIINNIENTSRKEFNTIYIHDASDSQHNNNIDELTQQDNFQSDIVFSFNHAITDGYTVFHICNSFLEALNDVIGSNVQCSYNFGKLNDGNETEEILLRRIELLKNNSEILEKHKAEMKDIDKEDTVIHEICPVSKYAVNTTKFIYRDLDKDKTSKLIKKFKEHQVSFHSGFTALTNWALIEVLTENGYSKKSLDIAVMHTLNLRRYWNNKCQEIQQGAHIESFSMKTYTERNVGDHFWCYAQNIHKLLKNYILENKSSDESIVRGFGSQSIERRIEEILKNLSTPKYYYGTTNMGDVSTILRGRGKHVSINWLTRCTSAHSGHMCMTHVTHTYEGRFLYGLAYYTKFVRDDLANMYVDKIFDKIDFLCR